MTHLKHIKFATYKTAFLSLAMLLATPFGANPAFADSLYEKQVNAFPWNSLNPSSSRTKIEFYNATPLRNWVKSINTDQTAFETKLLEGMCTDGQGSIDWNYSQTNAMITCNTSAFLSPSYKTKFLEAHCAGFCTKYGTKFKSFSYDKTTCICKGGVNAKQLQTGEPLQSESSKKNSTSWEIEGTTEVVAQRAEEPEVINESSNSTATSATEPKTISGTIVDETGNPLDMATVLAIDKNGDSKEITYSDDNGQFTITLPSDATSIKITYLDTKEYKCDYNQCPTQIKMTADNSTSISEVTVTGNKCNNLSTLNALHATEARATGEDSTCVPYACKDNYELEYEGQYKEGNTPTTYKNAICKPKTCTVANADPSSDLNRYECDATDTNCYCKVENCEDGYKPSDDKRRCIEVEVCTDEQKSKIAHFKKGYKQNNVCYVTKCDDSDYKPNDEKTACVQVGGECPTDKRAALTDQNITKTKLKDGICIVKACKPDYKPNDEKNGCIQSKGACESDVEHATAGEMKSGKCVVSECDKGYHPDQKNNKCVASELSEEGSQKKIDDLKKVAADAKAKEQSLANKTLGATAMLATGLGGQQLLSGLAEKSADQDAEADMRAYLATFACDYGRGRNIKGGETSVELPGGNELITSRQEYVALASDLKERKESLGLRAGIESEVILDKATTGLYDDVGVGITGGKYASVSRALLDANSADAAAWAQQKSDAASKIKTGATVAGIGAVGGLIGDMAINGTNSSIKKALNEVLNEKDYEKLKEPAKKLEQAVQQIPVTKTPCPAGSTGSQAPECKCTDSTKIFNTNSNQCESCPENEQPTASGMDCTCKSGYTYNDNNICVQLSQGVTPQCETTDKNMRVDPQTGACNCVNGYKKSTTDKNKCECNKPNIEKNGLCTEQSVTPILTLNGSDLTISLPADSLFDLGKSDLKKEAYTSIGEFKGQFKIWRQNYPEAPYCIKITGHTDRTGNDKINTPLSLNRAKAVQTALVGTGNNEISADHTITNGVGSKECNTQTKTQDQNCRKVTITFDQNNCNTTK